MIIQPPHGHSIRARLFIDERGAPRMVHGTRQQFDYALVPLLQEGWRVVDATPAEWRLLVAAGVQTGSVH